MLSANTNPIALKLLQKILELEPEKLKDWTNLSKNPLPEAMKILKNNFNKIDWVWLSYNSSDEAIQLLKENPDKINWNMLSANTNPKVLELLEKNQKKIWWQHLSANPSIPRIFSACSVIVRILSKGCSPSLRYPLRRKVIDSSLIQSNGSLLFILYCFFI